MRILFMHHFPLGHSDAGQWVQHWAGALAAVGHESCCLVLDRDAQKSDIVETVRITCRPEDPAADLPFEIPQFSTPTSTNRPLTFAALSNRQLAEYRECIRRRLDALIDSFNPHVIHAQHIWVQGQLALETGVPYVLNAWGPELTEYASDERYRSLADQAAENAARILVLDAWLMERVVTVFNSAADRAQIMPPGLRLTESPPSGAQARVADGLPALYETILAERFGAPPT